MTETSIAGKKVSVEIFNGIFDVSELMSGETLSKIDIEGEGQEVFDHIRF